MTHPLQGLPSSGPFLLRSFYSFPCTLCSSNIEFPALPLKNAFRSLYLHDSSPGPPPKCMVNRRAIWQSGGITFTAGLRRALYASGSVSSTEFSWQHHSILISIKCRISTLFVALWLKPLHQVRLKLLAGKSWGPVTGKWTGWLKGKYQFLSTYNVLHALHILFATCTTFNLYNKLAIFVPLKIRKIRLI